MSIVSDIRNRQARINSRIAEHNKQADRLINDIDRVNGIFSNAAEILSSLDREFEEKTKLNKLDIKFLFMATFLQVARWWILDNKSLRIKSTTGDKISGLIVKKVTPKSWSDVLLQSVPYDAMVVKESFKPILYSREPNGTGLSGNTHRYRTLGHDPVLGWLFGSVNILTDSLTKPNTTTYSVENNQIDGYYKGGMIKTFFDAYDMVKQDKLLLLSAVTRQGIHFTSDAFTKQGLPLPFLSCVDPDLVQKLMIKANVDLYAVVRGALMAQFINDIISYIHLQYFDGDNFNDIPLYQVRTKKILMYSNAMSAGANIAYVTTTKDVTKLDIGGIIVTLYEIFNDSKFIEKLKHEFIHEQFYKMVMEG